MAVLWLDFGACKPSYWRVKEDRQQGCIWNLVFESHDAKEDTEVHAMHIFKYNYRLSYSSSARHGKPSFHNKPFKVGPPYFITPRLSPAGGQLVQGFNKGPNHRVPTRRGPNTLVHVDCWDGCCACPRIFSKRRLLL